MSWRDMKLKSKGSTKMEEHVLVGCSYTVLSHSNKGFFTSIHLIVKPMWHSDRLQHLTWHVKFWFSNELEDILCTEHCSKTTPQQKHMITCLPSDMGSFVITLIPEFKLKSLRQKRKEIQGNLSRLIVKVLVTLQSCLSAIFNFLK